MKVVDKEFEIMQRKDLTLSYLENFYEKSDNVEKLILVFDDTVYWTVLTYDGLRSIATERELEVFLNVNCRHEYLCNEKDVDWAELIFQHEGNEFIPIIQEGIVGNFMQMITSIDEVTYKNNIGELIDYLKSKQMAVHYIRLPDANEMTMNVHEFRYFAGDNFMWRECNKKLVEKILRYITEYNYEKAKELALLNCSLEGKKLGNGIRRVFLVGGCIANGWHGFKGDDLATTLHNELDEKYEIHCVLMGHSSMTKKYEILEYDLRKDDQIIILDQGPKWRDSEIDVAELFSNYVGDKWLYFDEPVHTTKYGNEILAKKIIETFILPFNWKKDNVSKDIVHKGMPRLSYHGEELLIKYCDLCRTKFKGESSMYGALVMNCNPFTLGHRYLVETALQQVDNLYLFVVEEDASEFSFKERLEMVKSGTSDLKNVAVIPSGRFILSKESFRNYFEKEQLQGVVVDASKDLNIFAEYIAKRLNISKRFVGEEPYDTVTRQYNQQMKLILGEAGVEVVEIPRKLFDNKAISASKVRECLKKQDWETIGRLVPESTVQCLYKHIQVQRKRKKRRFDKYEKKMLQNIVNYVLNHDHVVMYGTGQDARALVDYLPEEALMKLEYCDKRAIEENYKFMGADVISPLELSDKKNHVSVLVCSTKFKYEIYDFLIKMGFENRQIFFSPISFREE